jgi:hypothetical protein
MRSNTIEAELLSGRVPNIVCLAEAIVLTSADRVVVSEVDLVTSN